MQADWRINPDSEDLPKGRLQEIMSHKVEVRAMNAATTRRSNWLRETRELWEEEAQEMWQAAEEHTDEVVEPQQSSEKDSETLGDILGLPPSRTTMTLSQGNEDIVSCCKP
jgi:hypothetical protein